jgi:hypothetical protein
MRVELRTQGTKVGYRAVVRRAANGSLQLRLVRAKGGSTTRLAATGVAPRARAGERIQVQLQAHGRLVRARAWVVGTGRPGWQVRVRDSDPVLRAGRAAVRVRLGARADRSATVRVRRGIVRERRPGPRLGVYNGMFEYDATRRQFGRYPGLATSYYQPNQTVNVARERERIRRGISPNITITAKGTQYYAALARGPAHHLYAEADRWLNRYIDGLAEVARINVDVPVYATLDHEFVMKQRTGMLTGASADPDVYGQVLRMFYRRARQANPDIRVTYWIVGYNREMEGQVARHFATPPDAIVFDPYAGVHNGANTLTDIVTEDLRWIRRQDWYVGQEIGLGEFGMQIARGDADLARFHRDIPTTLRHHGISWAIFFNRERDDDYKIVERSDGRRFLGAVSSFAQSLTASCS